MVHSRIPIWLAWHVAALGVGNIVWAQSPPTQPVIYPANGQSNEQLATDRDECYTWATNQTGFDPLQALQQQQALLALQAQQAAASPPPTGGQVVRGAAGGAAGGALIGAAAGNAGRGAAIGASVGAVAGAARRQREAEARAQAEQNAIQQQNQQLAAASQRLAEYQRFFVACMQGRRYTVL